MVNELQIPVRSGIVNGIVFVVVDVICLWAIHRGLMAIQGLSIWHAIRSGRSVQLKRSKVPILSGELLGSRGGVNWLVAAHIIFVILAGISSFGIDGATGTRRVSVPRSYESFMLSSRSDTDLEHAYAQRILLRCRKVDGSTITYNRAAFDLVGNTVLRDAANFRDNSGKVASVDLSSVLCIDGNPMLKVVNCTDCFRPTEPISTTILVRKRTIELPNNTVTNEPAPISDRKKPIGRDAARPVILAVRREVVSVSSGFAQVGDEIFCVEREKLPIRVFALPSLTPRPYVPSPTVVVPGPPLPPSSGLPVRPQTSVKPNPSGEAGTPSISIGLGVIVPSATATAFASASMTPIVLTSDSPGPRASSSVRPTSVANGVPISSPNNTSEQGVVGNGLSHSDTVVASPPLVANLSSSEPIPSKSSSGKETVSNPIPSSALEPIAPNPTISVAVPSSSTPPQGSAGPSLVPRTSPKAVILLDEPGLVGPASASPSFGPSGFSGPSASVKPNPSILDGTIPDRSSTPMPSSELGVAGNNITLTSPASLSSTRPSASAAATPNMYAAQSPQTSATAGLAPNEPNVIPNELPNQNVSISTSPSPSWVIEEEPVETEPPIAAEPTKEWMDFEIPDQLRPLQSRDIRPSNLAEKLPEGSVAPTPQEVPMEVANRILEIPTPSPTISPPTSEFRCVLARWDSKEQRVHAWFGRIEVVRRQIDDSLLTMEVSSGSATIEAKNKTTIESIFELGPYLLGPLRGNSLLDILDTSVLLLSGARTAVSGMETKETAITTITVPSWISMVIVVISAVILGPVRELFLWLWGGKGGQALLEINRFDVVSNLLGDAGVDSRAKSVSVQGRLRGRESVLGLDEQDTPSFLQVQTPQEWRNDGRPHASEVEM